MAEKQTAEDDDDEGFGDFKFVASPPSVHPNPTFQFSQINGPNLFFSSNNNNNNNNNDEDDEWGDFVDNSSPITAKSEFSGGLAATGSHPGNPSSNLSKPIDPFDFFSGNSSSTNANRADVPVMNRVESEKKLWVKPQGALPLSLFGDVEEEEEQKEEGSGVGGASNGGVTDFADRKRIDSKENGSNLNLGIGNNDIFANSANQTERINVESGFNSIMVPDKKIEQMKVENGLNSSSNGFDSLLSLGNNFEQIKAESELNLSSKEPNSNSDLNGFALDLNGDVASIVYNQSEQVNGKIESIFKPVGLNSISNGLDLKSNHLDSSINGGNEDLDDDDGWDFQGAELEIDRGDLNSKVDQKGNSEVAEYTSSMFVNGTNGSKDLFVVSNEISFKSSGLEYGFDFKPSSVAHNGFTFESHPRSEQNQAVDGNPRESDGNIDSDENIWEFKDAFAEAKSTHKPSTVAEVGFISDSQSISKQNEIGTESSPLPIEGRIDSDETFWEFRDSNSEFESKHKEEVKAADYSHGEFDVFLLDGQMQTNKTMSENQQGALPLSLFSEGKLDTDDSFNLQDGFAHNPPSNLRNGVGSQSSSISFDDILLNLYSQAEKTPSVNSTQKPINGLESISVVLDSNILNDDDDDDDFNDNSWEFKDALSDNSAKDQSPVLIADNAPVTMLKMESYMEFYTKLKDELFHIAYFHLDSLKKAKTAAALSSDNTKVGALDDEIQEAYKGLHLENIHSEVYSENYPPRISCLNDFLGTLQEPKFHVLESEYHLSKRLALAERDLKSAIELLSHAKSMLKLLTLGSVEEQSNYVSAWCRIISVCAQELKHGASIWKQALEKNVHPQIVFEPRGQQFIVALGEIYRVVKVVGASAKLYKPWMLSNLADPASIFALLEDCSSLWSSSGLEEALQSISNSIGFEYEGTIKDLLESIKHVHDLDVLAFQANLSATQEPTCRLSVLTPAMMPDLKLVVWDGEHYFLKLANLWANLISFDPPKLPHIRIG